MNSLLTFVLALADTAAAAPAAPAAPAATSAPAAQQPDGGFFGGSMLWVFVAMFGLMYFLMIRPQQKKQKQIQEMLSHLKVGDRVMTSSGMLGTITRVSDKTVRLNFGGKFEVDFVRAAVAEILPGGEGDEGKKEDSAADKKA